MSPWYPLAENRGEWGSLAQLWPKGGPASPPKRDFIRVTSGMGRYKDGASRYLSCAGCQMCRISTASSCTR